MSEASQSQRGQAQPQAAGPANTPARKPYVKPEISDSVDVLAATTFFQVVESGGTGAPPRPRG